MAIVTGKKLKQMGFTPNNTYLVIEGSESVLYLHGYKIAVYNAEERTVWFNNHGYSTATTKKRMNEFCRVFAPGLSVFQKNYDWFVKDRNKNKTFKYVDTVVYGV